MWRSLVDRVTTGGISVDGTSMGWDPRGWDPGGRGLCGPRPPWAEAWWTRSPWTRWAPQHPGLFGEALKQSRSPWTYWERLLWVQLRVWDQTQPRASSATSRERDQHLRKVIHPRPAFPFVRAQLLGLSTLNCLAGALIAPRAAGSLSSFPKSSAKEVPSPESRLWSSATPRMAKVGVALEDPWVPQILPGAIRTGPSRTCWSLGRFHLEEGNLVGLRHRLLDLLGSWLVSSTKPAQGRAGHRRGPCAAEGGDALGDPGDSG